MSLRTVGPRSTRFEDLDNDILIPEHLPGTISEDEASASDSPEESCGQTGGILKRALPDDADAAR